MSSENKEQSTIQDIQQGIKTCLDSKYFDMIFNVKSKDVD